VSDAPVTEQRIGLLDSLDIGFLIRDPEGIRAAGKVAKSIDLA